MKNPEETLQNSLKKLAKEQNYENCVLKIKSISSGGANFTSFLYLATLQAPEKEDLKLFAKVAAVGEEMRSISPFMIFEVENLFYDTILKKYKRLEEVNNVSVGHRLVIPKFYGASDEYLNETLLLEDLTASGYTTHDRFKSIDWEYACKGLENLAKFHALSFASSKDEPELFDELARLKIDLNKDVMKHYLQNILSKALQVTKEKNRERLSKFISELLESDIEKYARPRRRPVVTHGDYRTTNMMHRIVDGSLEVISVDYQTLQIGNPIIDIMYFIFNGSDKKFRDQHFKQCLEHYYRELCKALRRFGLDPEEVYSRDDYDYELKEILPSGLMISVFCLLTLTVETEEAPQMNEDSSLEDFVLNPNKIYAERLNDIVDDFIYMGII